MITGDGNCLMHAVSLSLWSFSDHNTLLRRLVYYAFASDRGSFQTRWKKRQERIDHEEGGMLHAPEVIFRPECLASTSILLFAVSCHNMNNNHYTHVYLDDDGILTCCFDTHYIF